MKKECIKCNKIKPLKSFSTKGKDRKQRKSTCNTCRRKVKFIVNPEYTRKRTLKNYGLVEDDYNKLLIDQGQSCAICGMHESNCRRKLCVDHCHKTLKIRGLLCDNCNTSIGLFKDSTDILWKAIRYLQK